MIRFKDYIWMRVRGGILLLSLLLTTISVISYTSVIIFLKNRQLKSSLSVAAYTVHEAVGAGDWTLALGHLRALEKSGPVYRIQLRSTNGGSNVTGPFGEKPFGIGSWCSEAPVGEELALGGCMRVFGETELYTALLFFLLAAALFFSAFRLFRSKMLLFIGKISEELGGMRALEGSESKTPRMPRTGTDIAEIASIRDYILCLLDETEKATEALAKNQLSAQVAHDIRSPLTALNMVAEDLHVLPESQRILIRSAVTRIQDIANNLLQQNDERVESVPSLKANKSITPGISNHLLSSLIDAIVSEKRLQYRSRLGIEIKASIDAASYGVFARIDPSEFKRVLSNLINNSVEAISGNGRVEVCLSGTSDGVTLLVRDSGKGIPEGILPRLMKKEATFGKPGGSGLGLYHAKNAVESWGGTIGIESRVAQGTTVKITLAKASPPEWFVPELQLVNGTAVVILDDDISIHQIWQKRFEGVGAGSIQCFHFSTNEEIVSWHRSERARGAPVRYLIDFELLGGSRNGLEIIDSLDISEDSILVTSRYDEQRVIEGCLRLGVCLIPKALAAFVPISLSATDDSTPDCVLIDDDPMVRMSWRHSARRLGKRLRTFQLPETFFDSAGAVPRNTPIYIDAHLRDGIRGELVAKEISERGFESIFLTTGYCETEFTEMPWLKKIVDKRPPWGKHSQP